MNAVLQEGKYTSWIMDMTDLRSLQHEQKTNKTDTRIELTTEPVNTGVHLSKLSPHKEEVE